VTSKQSLRALGAALVLSCAFAPGASALPPPDEDTGNWDFDIALYSWITDITGQAGIGDITVDVEPQLWNDIISNLDMAFFGGAEARYQSRWILNLDLFYAKISSESESGPYSIGFGPKTLQRDTRPINSNLSLDTRLGELDVPFRFDAGTLRVDVPRVETAIGPFDIETSLTQVIVRGFAGWRALNEPLPAFLGGDGEDDPRRVRFDLIGGARYYYMKTEVDIDAPPVKIPSFQVTSSLSGGSVRVGGDRFPGRKTSLGTINLPSAQFPGATLGGTDISVEESVWWIDPIVGARVGADVTEKLSLSLMGNVGGFGIGSASHFSWETTVFANYLFGEHWSFAAGYRALGFDRAFGDLELDLIIHGPVLGFIYRF
jgi:hypothetical protein